MSDLSTFKKSQPPKASAKQSSMDNGTDCYIKALTGEYKGKVFKLTSNEIYIGREKSNHISIATDIKVSRKHARFIKSKGKLYIQDISPNNYIKVNNEVKKKSVLHNGFTVTVGEQIFKVILDNKTPNAFPNTDNQIKSKSFLEKNKNFAVGGAFVLVGLLFLSNFTKKEIKNKTLNLRDIATSDALDERINQKTKDLEKIEEELSVSEKSNPQYISANKHYLRGFREFQKGIYSAAVSSFETALSLYPEHHLARRYRNLAETRLDELIDLQITQGRVYLDNAQYDYCISAYQNAMYSSYKKGDKRYIEAKLGLSRCEKLKRSQY